MWLSPECIHPACWTTGVVVRPQDRGVLATHRHEGARVRQSPARVRDSGATNHGPGRDPADLVASLGQLATTGYVPAAPWWSRAYRRLRENVPFLVTTSPGAAERGVERRRQAIRATVAKPSITMPTGCRRTELRGEAAHERAGSHPQ